MMIANFYLLGAFELQVGLAQKQAISDTMASKILAYLAFRNEFCTRDEIVQACWGKHKVTGDDKLEDEAYKRQVSNLRSLLTDLGLPFEEYLLAQPNGLELREGTFTTDVIRFDELLRVGLNRELAAADRLAALQEAEGMRRGYLLDGMRCEWIVTHEGGARRDYGAKFQDVRREIQQLQGASNLGAPNANHVAYCVGFDDLISALKASVATASDEIIFYGINFHITIPAIRNMLLERLRHGATIKILHLDPYGQWLPEMARATSNEHITLRSEGIASLSGLMEIRRKWEAETDRDGLERFEVRLFDSMIHGRIYATDPEWDSGRLLYFPYLYGASPSQLPGFQWTRRTDGPFVTYVNELRRLWDSSARSISKMSEAGELS